MSPYLKTTIMRRVRVIWFARRVLPLLVLETVAVALVVQQLATNVFVNHVLQNAIIHTFSRSPVMMADFFFRAFLNTETLVQMLVLGSLVVGMLLARDAARTFRAFVTKQSNLSPLSHVM